VPTVITAAPVPSAVPLPSSAPVASAPSVASVALEKKPLSAAALPRSITYEGLVERGLHFADRNGDNWVVVSTKEATKPGATDWDSTLRSKYLFVRHVVLDATGPRELRLLRDHEVDCDFDLLLRVTEEAFTVTDVDADGYGEVNLGYESACRSDVSPATYKFFLLENGAKFGVRGTTKVPDGTTWWGGDMKADPELEAQPALFAHAKALWPKLTKRPL